MTMTGMDWSKRPSRGLLVTGVIELIVGGAMILGAFTVPLFSASQGTIVGVGVLLVVLGLVFLFLGKKAGGTYAESQRLKATGLPGSGAITGLEQTGITMNDQPQVKINMMVTVPGHEPYPIMLKQYVPMIMLGRLTSGAPLPVKVDPANLQHVVIEWEAGGVAPTGAGGQGVIVGKDVAATPELVAQAASQGMIPSESDLEYKRTRLKQFGKDGSAVVQSVQDTGQMVGSNKLFIVDLILTIEGKTTDSPASAAAVNPADADKVKAGVVVPIKYDPADHDQMTLLWEEAKPPSA